MMLALAFQRRLLELAQAFGLALQCPWPRPPMKCLTSTRQWQLVPGLHLASTLRRLLSPGACSTSTPTRQRPPLLASPVLASG